MKKFLLAVFVASLAAGAFALLPGAGPLSAREDHRAYRALKFDECNECHKGSGVSANHKAAWNAEHRTIAVKESAPCADCHDQSWCADCHYGGGIDRDLHVSNDRGPNYVPKSHRTDFREIHPIAAFDNPNSCSRCHQPSFCSGCHARFRPEELQFLSHRKGWSDLSPSPGGPKHSTFPADSCATCHPGSVLPSHKWSGSHAQEARRNLPTCQACHPDGDVCLKCHSARSGLKVNPHPDNWDDIKGRLNRAAGQRTCVKCH